MVYIDLSICALIHFKYQKINNIQSFLGSLIAM